MDDLSPEPSNIRFLRRLVTVLTATMIIGITAIFILMFIRVSGETPALNLTLPGEIELPAGANATAFTIGDSWYAVVTDSESILIFDRETGALRQTIDVK